MRKFNCLFVLLFVLFIPRVYAFTYEIDTNVSNTEVTKGSVVEIKVGLKNIQGTSEGIASCTLNIEFGNNILLDSKIRSLGSWTMTTGNIYLFDTADAAVSSSDLFVIPIKVNGNGNVKIYDIECSDGETLVPVNDKTVNFTIKEVTTDDGDNTQNSGTQNDSTNNEELDKAKSSNCDLSNIELSEGTIVFDSSVTDYYLDIDNFENLVVEPVLADNKASFSINKTDEKTIVINVIAEDGTEKTYTILNERGSLDTDIDDEDNNNYVPIFIAIIVVLILINIFRIVKNKRKK